MTIQHIPFLVPTMALLLGSAACSAGASEEESTAAEEAAAAKGNGAPTAAEQHGNAAGTDGADDRPVRQITESDRLWLEMAQAACKANDFKSFLRAFSGSWLVQERYTAPMVQFGQVGTSRSVPMRRYLDQNHFPFTPMDNSYATRESVMLFESDAEPDWRKLRFVQVEFNSAGDNRQRVDWVSGLFERNLDPPPAHLEEGLGELIQPSISGYVLFEPTENCWQLTQDVSNPPEQP